MRRLKYSFIFIILSSMVFPVGSARAVVIKDLYEALVPVQTQSREERKEALKNGLIEILTRVSGRTLLVSEDPEDPLLVAVQNPTRFTRQFRYRKAGKKTGNLSLWIKYDEKAVNNLLQSNDLSVWGHTRPPTLIWLVLTENGRRILLSNTENHPVKSMLRTVANKRGLPLTFPLMDLTDRGNISISDIWGNFEDRIVTASKRYNTEAVIVGRLYKDTENKWSARWSIYQQGRRQDFNVDNEINLEYTITPVLAQTAETLAQQYAMVKTEDLTEDVVVKINGVGSLKEFNRITKYLKSLAAVSEVNPVLLGEESAMFKLTTSGGRIAISQAIKLGHVLAEQLPANGAEYPGSGGPDLIYQMIQ